MSAAAHRGLGGQCAPPNVTASNTTVGGKDHVENGGQATYTSFTESLVLTLIAASIRRSGM